MIRINVIGIAALALFVLTVWCAWPVWYAVALLLAELPQVRWFLAGSVTGLFVPLAIGWNMALWHRRQQMIDKANDEYERDRWGIRGK